MNNMVAAAGMLVAASTPVAAEGGTLVIIDPKETKFEVITDCARMKLEECALEHVFAVNMATEVVPATECNTKVVSPRIMTICRKNGKPSN